MLVRSWRINAESSMMSALIVFVPFIAVPDCRLQLQCPSEKRDIAIKLLFLQADEVDQFLLRRPLGLVHTEIFEECFSGVCVIQKTTWLIAAHVFPNDGNSFCFQEFSYKIYISLRHPIETFTYFKYMAATKNLGLETAAVRAEFHHLTDQQFHGIYPIARACWIPGVGAVRQHKVIHAAYTNRRVTQACRDARPQDRVDDRRLMTHVEPSDVDGHPWEFMFVRRCRWRYVHCCIGANAVRGFFVC